MRAHCVPQFHWGLWLRVQPYGLSSSNAFALYFSFLWSCYEINVQVVSVHKEGECKDAKMKIGVSQKSTFFERKGLFRTELIDFFFFREKNAFSEKRPFSSFYFFIWTEGNFDMRLCIDINHGILLRE